MPWWWTYIKGLLTRFDNIRQMAALSHDEKPPPKDMWLDDEALEQWKKDQEELRKMQHG